MTLLARLYLFDPTVACFTLVLCAPVIAAITLWRFELRREDALGRRLLSKVVCGPSDSAAYYFPANLRLVNQRNKVHFFICRPGIWLVRIVERKS